MGSRQYKKADGDNEGEGSGYIAGEPEIFFELALNGIGGNTINEVKNNLSMYEVNQWSEYRQRRGSLNTGRRVEQTVANIGTIFLNKEIQNSEDYLEPLQLMPYEDNVVETFEDSIK